MYANEAVDMRVEPPMEGGPAEPIVTVMVTRLDDEPVKVADIGAVMAGIGGFNKTLAETLRSTGAAKANVEFGVKLAAKTGEVAALFAEVSGEATLKVTLSFEFPPMR